MQQSQEFRHDAFYRIRHEYLIAVELNLVALHLYIVLNLGEVQNTRQVEGVVHIQVNPKQRLVSHGEEVTVELLVVLVLQFTGLLNPQRLYIIYNIVLFCIHLLAVLPFCFLAECNGYGQEVAVLTQQVFYLVLLQKLLAVVVDVHNDAGSTVFLFHFLQGERRAAVATPFHSRSVLIALSNDVHLFADHKGAVESQSEVANNGIGIILVFVQKVVGTREGNLVDVLLYLIGSHTYTTVGNGNGLGILVNANGYFQISQFAFEFTLAA